MKGYCFAREMSGLGRCSTGCQPRTHPEHLLVVLGQVRASLSLSPLTSDLAASRDCQERGPGCLHHGDRRQSKDLHIAPLAGIRVVGVARANALRHLCTESREELGVGSWCCDLGRPGPVLDSTHNPSLPCPSSPELMQTGSGQQAASTW